jgi:hypothetical protein
MRWVGLALLILPAAAPWTGAGAEVVYLANGHRLVVDGWREEEEQDELVFFVGGGRVWIAKSEVTRIEEGRPAAVASSTDGFASAVSPAPPPPRPRLRLEPDEAVQRMRALLKQGEALFHDRLLSPAQKLRALQWLDDRWQELEVAEPLRALYAQGAQALRLTGEAFQAAGAGSAEASERTAAAAAAVRDAAAGLP